RSAKVRMARDNNFSGFSALRRFAREETGKSAAEEKTVSEERCDLCGAAIPPDPDHRHLMEVATREISCACRPCSILFDSSAASEGRYRIVPDRILDLEDFEMSDALWDSLRVPVDMAFFFYNTPAGKVVAYYPSPMGPTESLLELDAWEDLEVRNPALKDMERDVEALLVNRARGASEHLLVPMDECYKLVGLIRTRWRGFSGGREVWDDITRFFDGLKQRSNRATRNGN
ncbi:MAG: DUF5947 family protein, partial [Rubrobacter sp.]